MKMSNQSRYLLVFMRTLLTGFIGGLFWSALSVGLYYFNFIEVAPKTYFLRSWTKAAWTSGWQGDVVSIILASLLSIIVALIYFVILKKVPSIWMGATYGIFLWIIVLFGFHSLLPNLQSVVELTTDTLISSLCLFVLYGIFIGYSISFDYSDTVDKEYD